MTKPDLKSLWVLMLIAISSVPSAGAQRGPVASAVEDIFVVRSVRTSRGMPTDFCAEGRTGFGSATFEDRYDFHATTTRPLDGKMMDPLGNRVGQVHGCFGETSNPLKANFYLEGTLASLSFSGKGECEAPKADFPEAGITIFRCFLELSNLPRGYVGGLLTTNSLRSRQAIGPASDPPGYIQPSIATVRLWKQR